MIQIESKNKITKVVILDDGSKKTVTTDKKTNVSDIDIDGEKKIDNDDNNDNDNNVNDGKKNDDVNDNNNEERKESRQKEVGVIPKEICVICLENEASTKHQMCLICEQIHLQDVAYRAQTMTDRGEEPKRNIFVMRHGKRLDDSTLKKINDSNLKAWKEDESYVDYDTPLTSDGYQEISDNIKKVVSHFKIDTIICSPFLRCRQTAVQAATTLGMDHSSIFCDFGLGEVWNKTIIKGKDKVKPEYPYSKLVNQYTEHKANLKDQNKSTGSTEGKTSDEVLEFSLETKFILPTPSNIKAPVFGESLDTAYTRYVDSIHRITENTKGNILICTHGDGVRAYVRSVMGKDNLYQCDYSAIAHVEIEDLESSILNYVGLGFF